jgi:oligopeptide transport system substrate-binding protein
MALPRTLLTAIALAAAAAGCGGAGDDAVDVVVIGEGPAALVDPSAGPLSGPNAALLSSVAQGLVRFDGRGQIEPGLAERWNVSNDGLSYIFRLTTGEWPDGRKITARDVSRILSRQLRSASRNPLKDALGAVEEIVPMTERVIEIRLRAPRPNLLQLLAQPELAIVRERLGTGPFQPEAKSGAPGAVALTHRVRIVDAPDRIENIWLSAAPAVRAIADFRADKADLVLGGTFVDLPLARRVRLGRRELRFDPVAGLFGLAPGRKSGLLEDSDVRDLLGRAIDREALIASLDVPGLMPRVTLLQAGLEGIRPPVAPQWASVPLAERRPALIAEARRLFGTEKTELRIALPEGPGATILFNRLAADWAPLGIQLRRVSVGEWADLKLIDSVAPSTSPAWFVRAFRCDTAPVCSEDADNLMDSAREAPVAAQRAAMLAEAGRLIDEEVLFLPLAAPIRWSLVSDDVEGFVENIFARHPLTGLGDRPGRERQ